MHVSILMWFIENLDREEFDGKEVLEVGSRYVNGSIRPVVEKFCNPKRYVGVDIEPGKYVDIVLPVEDALDYFGENSFDVIISTETLEHIRDWRKAINNMKLLLRPGGYLYITTRSRGFKYHGYPHDYWRYEIDDMKRIFSDFEILSLCRDWEAPGVFLKARKPINWRPIDHSNIELYSVLTGKRIGDIPDKIPFIRRIRFKISSTAKKLGKKIVEVK